MRRWCGGWGEWVGRVAVLVCNREQGVLKVLGIAKTAGTAILSPRTEHVAAMWGCKTCCFTTVTRQRTRLWGE